MKIVTHSDSKIVNGLLSGYAWSGGSVSFGFPQGKSAYHYGGEPGHNFKPISAAQQKAALFALEQSYGGAANNGFSVEGFTNLAVTKVSPGNADIRFGQSSSANPTAYSYYPSNSDRGGDVWFGSHYNYRSPNEGNYSWVTMLHELGHALGLKHGHRAEGGFQALPNKLDSLEFSVMTYHTFINGPAKGYTFSNGSAPQTFMMADVAALQYMYGADFTTNSGDTTYEWRPGNGNTLVNGKIAISPVNNHIFATIWDGGGTDTYDLHTYHSNLKISLAPGGHSAFKASQLADLGGGPNHGHARGNIFNALLFEGDQRSLIENAIGGRGNDSIVGNVADNTLRGKGGRDSLNGGRGEDILIGGSGADKFVFAHNSGNDQINDYHDNLDKLVIKGFGLADKADALTHASQVGSNVELDFGNGDVLLILNLQLGNFTNSDFILV